MALAKPVVAAWRRSAIVGELPTPGSLATASWRWWVASSTQPASWPEDDSAPCLTPYRSRCETKRKRHRPPRLTGSVRTKKMACQHTRSRLAKWSLWRRRGWQASHGEVRRPRSAFLGRSIAFPSSAPGARTVNPYHPPEWSAWEWHTHMAHSPRNRLRKSLTHTPSGLQLLLVHAVEAMGFHVLPMLAKVLSGPRKTTTKSLFNRSTIRQRQKPDKERWRTTWISRPQPGPWPQAVADE